MKIKWGNMLYFVGITLFFCIFTQRSHAEEIVAKESTIKKVKAIEFEVKREGEKFVLENLTIEKSFGKIASVTISMPTGVHLTINKPANWTSVNDPNDSVINYTIAPESTPEEVEAELKKISFSIDKEQKTQGNIEISLSEKTISAWKDPEDPNAVPHYYLFVRAHGISWLDAYNAAKQSTYKGLIGYLATIANEREHDYIYKSVANFPGFLGGTRMTFNNNQKISDEDRILNTINAYNLNSDQWYWVDGPEAGQVFYIGKTNGGTTPVGAYNLWNAPKEPNNGNSTLPNLNLEYVLQFATEGSKLWNDLGNEMASLDYHQGYYVEYSAYGGQVEIEENSHKAAVPQLVTVQYRDQENNEMLAPEEMTGKNFAIGTAYDTKVLKKIIPGYDEVTPIPPNEQGKHQATPTIVTYYYKKQRITLHLQQVILDTNTALVVPSKGYAEIKNVDALDPNDVTTIYERMNALTSSLIADSNVYKKTTIKRNLSGRYYQIEVIQPSNYQIEGYVLSDNIVIPHAPSAIKKGLPVIDSTGEKEYWLTFYFKPTTSTPRPYSWDYSEIEFVEIK